MELSTNELFHFTKIEYLKSILYDQGFYPRYNHEFVLFDEMSESKGALWGIPMVCFCDIPIELSDEHRKRYGNVGIAMSEKWKLEKRLNPVTYIQSESSLAQSLAHLTLLDKKLDKIYSKYHSDEMMMDCVNTIVKLNHLFYYCKQFENKKAKKVKFGNKIYEFEKRRFYDEREWRFIPFELELKDQSYIHIDIEQFDDKNKIENLNILLRKHKLTFEYSDIECIIVENQKEKIDIQNIIMKKSKNAIESIEIKVL